MYEVFLNDRRINIASKRKITLNKSIQLVEHLTTKEAVKKWFYQFVDNDYSEVTLLHLSPGYFFKNTFQPLFKSIQAAGGIVIRRNKLLFIFRNKKWDLPKGKIEAGESAQKAAIREVQEECGISNHKITKQLPSTFHIYQSPHKKPKGQWIFKEIFWFEMEYAGEENGVPQKEENITEVKWFAQNELQLPLKNTFASLKSIISNYSY